VKRLVLELDELRRLGIAVVSYSENIDTGGPLGQAIFTIIAAMA
jgi:DNA invertase Pin-like site-specific DNA recombinase